MTLYIFNQLSVVEYREAEYRDHRFQEIFRFQVTFGLDTPDKHGLLDQRSTFESKYQTANLNNKNSSIQRRDLELVLRAAIWADGRQHYFFAAIQAQIQVFQVGQV
jgi:hypothetical protein